MTPTPTRSDRRDGAKRAMRSSATGESRRSRESAGTAFAGTSRTSPLPAKLLQLGQRDVAEELDLVLEHDAEFFPGAPARLGHEGERVRRRRAAGVLDEVRVFRGDARTADREASQS